MLLLFPLYFFPQTLSIRVLAPYKLILPRLGLYLLDFQYIGSLHALNRCLLFLWA